MKNTLYVLLVLTLLTILSCRHDHPHQQGETKFTSLTREQVEKLLPYMTDLRADGPVVTTADSVMTKDSIVIRHHQNQQSFTFNIMVDENDRPVMPDSTTTTERRSGGGMRTGNFSILCIGGCVGSAGGFPCVESGCAPIDQSCGCTPQFCGTCDPLDCTSHVLGGLSGGFVMQ